MHQEIHYFDFGFLLWTGGFCIVWSVGLAIGQIRRTDIGAIALVAISGMRLLWECYFLSGFAFLEPVWYGSVLPVMYLIGPFVFLYYERLADRRFDFSAVYHLLPFILSIVFSILWLIADNARQLELLDELIAAQVSALPLSLFELWVIGPKISILFYSLWIPLRRSSEGAQALLGLPPGVRAFAALLLAYIWIMIAADIAGYILNLEVLYRYSAYSHGVVTILVYLYSRINPLAILEIEKSVRASRYARSKLTGLNVQQTLLRLDTLMTQQSYYADEDLNLATLAEACELTPHQLSELLNAQMELGFNRFVNRYRVKAACDMLTEEPDRNILTIAMASGFNSKSSFYRAFKDEIGITPVEYRRRLFENKRPIP